MLTTLLPFDESQGRTLWMGVWRSKTRDPSPVWAELGPVQPSLSLVLLCVILTVVSGCDFLPYIWVMVFVWHLTDPDHGQGGVAWQYLWAMCSQVYLLTLSLSIKEHRSSNITSIWRGSTGWLPMVVTTHTWLLWWWWPMVLVLLWILMIEIRRTSRHWYGLAGPYLWLNPQILKHDRQGEGRRY